MTLMKLLLLLALLASTLPAAETLSVFDRQWSVRVADDWKTEQAEGATVLRLATNRGPLPGPRRPIQFALTDVPAYEVLTVEADVQPLTRSLILVFGYRDEAHFDYAHLSTDTGTKQPVHNGVFHVYGGERVRISNEAGPATFASLNRWYHVVLTHNSRTGEVTVTAEGTPVAALHAFDLSLGAGKVGIGSFDETALFKNVKISTKPARQ